MNGAEPTPGIPVHIFVALFIMTILTLGYTTQQARGRQVAWGMMTATALMAARRRSAEPARLLM